MRTHLRKRNPTKRCYLCKELGHLAKKCMNIGKVEDEKKSKANNIMTQMKQKWVRKYPKNSCKNSEVIDTQSNELGDLIISI